MNARGRQADRRRASACACSPRSSSKEFTSAKLSPMIGPAKANGTDGNSDGAGVPTAPDGDCDSDGVKNRVDLDDDNDLLPDTLELSARRSTRATRDTDGDGVEDGFEYQSALDLNNDDYQQPELLDPVPGQDGLPEPAVQGRGHRLRRRRLCARARSTSSGSTPTRSTTPPRAR